jgi:uncharacterized protein YtpQ (UPF0354 family)
LKPAVLALALAALPAMASAAAQQIPTDAAAFTEFVAGQLRKEPLAGQAVTVKGALTLKVGDLQANLDRVFGFCRSNAGACQEEIDRYTQGVAQVIQDMNAPPQKEAVRLAVRPSSYARESTSSGGKAIQTWPLAGELLIMPVLDSSRTTRSLADEDFKKLGLNADQIYQLGQANLNATLKPLMSQARVAKHGQIGQVAGDTYESSRLALHDSWAPLAEAQGGILIVAAPAKDALFYIGEDTPQAVDALRALVNDLIRKVPNPLSTELLRWTKTGWSPVR